MDYAVKANHLTKIYRDLTAVSDMSLHIRPGSICGSLGPNGAGKSATMKMSLGLTKSTSDSLEIAGKHPPVNRVEILCSIGSFTELPSFYANLTERENLEITKRILGLPHSSVDEALGLVGLREFDGRLAWKYPLGMKQRLGLTGAMLGKLSILFPDKPTNGFDSADIHEVRNLMTSLPSRYDCTVLITSYLLAGVELVAQNIGILSHGRMLSEGSLEALRGLAVHEGLAESSLEDTFLVVIKNDNATHRERVLL